MKTMYSLAHAHILFGMEFIILKNVTQKSLSLH